MILILKDITHLKKIEELYQNSSKELTVIIDYIDPLDLQKNRSRLKVYPLSKFVGDDCDDRVWNHILDIVKRWRTNNSFIAEKYEKTVGVPLEDSLAFVLSALLSRDLRLADTLIRAHLECGGGEVFTEKRFLPICQLAGLVPLSVIDLKNNVVSNVANNSVLNIINLMHDAFRIIAVPVSWWVNNHKAEYFRNCEILLIGGEQSRTFKSVWMNISLLREGKAGELLYGSDFRKQEYRQLINRRRDKRIGFIEGLCPIVGLLRTIKNIFVFSCAYLRANIQHSLAFSKSESPAYSKIIDRAIIRSVGTCSIFFESASNLVKSGKLKCVIFSRGGLWSSILSVVFRRARVRTIFHTHGMVMDPVGYTTHDTTKITWGVFDSDLLKRFYSSSNYLHTKEAPRRQWITGSPKIWKCYRYELGKNRFIETCAQEIQGPQLGVMPTSNRRKAEMQFFLKICFDYYRQNPLGIKNQGIILKIHPSSQESEYFSLINKIGVLPEVPIYICREGEIGWFVKRMNFCLVYQSSSLLNLLHSEIPFSIFTYGSYMNRTFINQFPTWMRFQSRADLDKIRSSDIQSFESVCKRLQRIYWGDNGLDEDELIRAINNTD